MEKHIKSKKYKRPVLVFCVLCFVLSPLFLSLGLLPNVYAEETQYSGVLEDLQQDSSFSQSEWDNLLLHPNTELIQIAESEDNELFLYVHFVGDIKPLSLVVFSTTKDVDNPDFDSYDIECVSKNGSFAKYLVKGYIPPSSSHLYAITRLEYPVDRPLQGTQEQTYEYIPVEQIWTVAYTADGITYSQEHLVTVEITDRYVGNHHAATYNSAGWYTSWTDTYYIAFSTEINMDELVEVQIEYNLYHCTMSGVVDKKPYTEKPLNTVVNADSTVNFIEGIRDNFWFISWNVGENRRKFEAISSPKEFRENSGINVPKREDKSEYDWVVTFHSDTKEYNPPVGVMVTYSVPGDTSILRLKYKKDGVTYNVGVLDTRTSYIPPLKSDDPWAWLKDILNWIKDNWYWLVIGVVVIFALIMLAPFLPSIAIGIGNFLLLLLKGLLWLITLPFRGIAALVVLIKSKKDGSS